MDPESSREVTHNILVFPMVCAFLILSIARYCRRQPDLSHILSIGWPIIPSSWVGAETILFGAKELLHSGYRQGLSTFKIHLFMRWIVVVTGAPLLEQLRKGSEEDWLHEDTETEAKWLRVAGFPTSNIRTALFSTRLVRNLPLTFLKMQEEIVIAFSGLILDETQSEWTTALAADTMTEIVSVIYNRVIFGLPICQDTGLIAFNKRYIRYKTVTQVIFFKALQFIVLQLFGGFPSHARHIHQLLEPVLVRQRLKTSLHESDHSLLSSLIVESTGPDALCDITNSILALNLQAVPKTSLTLTHALYHLAVASEDVVLLMREDITAALRPEGWTVHALDHMRRVDSFLKESMRLSGLYALTMRRVTRTDYTFTDGTYVPPGTLLCAACIPTHLDPAKYICPETFDAFRFVRGDVDVGGTRDQLVTTSADFLAWGHGRKACPGRFLAAALMKSVLAYIVLHYDVRLQDAKSVRPRDWWVGAERLPDLNAHVMFRRRR